MEKRHARIAEEQKVFRTVYRLDRFLVSLDLRMPFVILATGKLQFLRNDLIVPVADPLSVFTRLTEFASPTIDFRLGPGKVVADAPVVTEAAFPEAGGFVEPAGRILQADELFPTVKELISNCNIQDNDLHFALS